jgi:hypothetical protein
VRAARIVAAMTAEPALSKRAGSRTELEAFAFPI